MSKLALAEEQERRRIAAELHDSTIQDLGLLKFRLSAYLKTQTDNTTTGNLSEILATLDKAINDTRTLVFELSPPILYEIGFVPALEWLAEQFYRQRGLACKVIDDGRDKPLDTSMMVILFQIVRELLINISKHAGATSSSITIKRTGETVSIKVADNGKGFDADRIDDLTSQMEGFGLFSIRERLNSIEGEFSIESSPGKGTSITLSAPLMLEPVETV
jgi:signal transduction histidine kinase